MPSYGMGWYSVLWRCQCLRTEIYSGAYVDRFSLNAERLGAADAPQPVESSNATAQAAAEYECYRAVVDLQQVAQKLDKHKFQEKAQLLENVDNKAMFVTARVHASCRMSAAVRSRARLKSQSWCAGATGGGSKKMHLVVFGESTAPCC